MIAKDVMVPRDAMVSLEGFKFRCELVQDTEPASLSWVLPVILGVQKALPLSQAGASYQLTLPRATTHNVVPNPPSSVPGLHCPQLLSWYLMLTVSHCTDSCLRLLLL